MPSALTSVLAGLGVGVALAGSPGPVQAILLVESIRGGTGRGFKAQAGANLTFAALLVALALGLAAVAPSAFLLRILKVTGGAFLIWLAIDGFRSRHELTRDPSKHRRLPPAVRGLLAVVLNPGTYLFLATAASSLLSSASREGGITAALLAALALVVGVAIGDGAVVLLGGLGVRRAGQRVTRLVRTVLAGLLAVLGVLLIVSGVRG
jgi:threonine/homoserine/homoserine lactone efflux protein